LGLLKHLLDIKSLTRDELATLLINARSFIEVSTREIKKVPALRGKTVINLFLEPSTRTRTSFEIAGKRLSADVINISEGSSSVVKGETLLDTARTLQSMKPDILVLRHKESGSARFLAELLGTTAVVNAGDGMHEHPTQALLDCLTLWERFAGENDSADDLTPISKRTIAIVGDVRHSRVARSSIYAQLLLGNTVRLVGPPTLVPAEFADPRFLQFDSPAGEAAVGKLSVHHSLAEGLEGADVVMCLRMQLERQSDHFIPSLTEYSRFFCVGERLLAKHCPDCVVLHPGPMNRGTEISSEVADGPRSLIANQVTHGVAVRMAVLFALCSGERHVDRSQEESHDRN